MCQILDHHSGSEPVSLAIFRELDQRNPDGIGLAYVNPKRGTLTTYRTLTNVKEAYNRYLNAARAGHRVLVHWRFTTHGKSTEDNCHPFPLPNGAVLFHNGMLPIKPSHADKSDTRTLALDCVRAGLDPFDVNVSRRNAARRLLTAVSEGSRLIALSADGEVWRCGAWVDDLPNGRAWANAGCSLAPMSERSSYYHSARGWNDDDYDWHKPVTPAASDNQIRGQLTAGAVMQHYRATGATLYVCDAMKDGGDEWFIALCDDCRMMYPDANRATWAESITYANNWKDAKYVKPVCELCYTPKP